MKRKLFLLFTGLVTAATLLLALLLAVSSATAQSSERPDHTPTPGAALVISGTGNFLITDVTFLAPPIATLAPPQVGVSSLAITAAPDPRLEEAELILRPFWRDLIIRQRDYFAIYGRFYQGSVIRPGANFTRTVTRDTPSDEGMAWVEFMGGDFTYTIPIPIRVDTYDGPRGQAFALYTRALGYEKRVCYGRYARCSYDWRLVVP